MTSKTRHTVDFGVPLWHFNDVENDESRPEANPTGLPDISALRSALANYFRTRISNRSEVEDLVQEVFARLAARRDGEPIEHLDRYLFQTAFSVLADRIRRQKVRRAEHHVEFDADRHSPIDVDPYHTLSSREDLQAARRVLLELPERTRTIFILHRLEGLRYRDIASQLGISASAVQKHMAHAALYLLENMGARE